MKKNKILFFSQNYADFQELSRTSILLKQNNFVSKIVSVSGDYFNYNNRKIKISFDVFDLLILWKKSSLHFFLIQKRNKFKSLLVNIINKSIVLVNK